jgi:hypothetical protein
VPLTDAEELLTTTEKFGIDISETAETDYTAEEFGM